MAKLIVIGNGADLHCQLNSSFSSFFESVFTKGEHFNNSKIRSNIWYLLIFFRFYRGNDLGMFECLSNTNPLWMNIEEFISEILNGKFDGNQEPIISVIKDAIEKRAGYIENQYKLDYIEYDTYIGQMHEVASCVVRNVGNDRTKDPYEFLLDELKCFEKDFAEYLKKEIQNNEAYVAAINSFIYDISNKKDCFVLSFNYTSYLLDYKALSVHGQLDKNNIIIGIDLNKLKNGKAKRFTKAWRKLNQYAASLDIPKTINEIIFYGHSLGEQDYAYFHSLFTYYDIYNSSVKLTFLYSNHEFIDKSRMKPDNEKNAINRDSYIDSVFELLSNYIANTKTETDSKSVTTKIQLENRLRILELDDYLNLINPGRAQKEFLNVLKEGIKIQ